MSHPLSVIVDVMRTPLGAFQGGLAAIPATALAARCIQAIRDRAGLPGEAVDALLLGQVLTAGAGQNPARQAGLAGGLPPSVGATTINKLCGSGLQALLLADQAIRCGDAHLVFAGGMESMSRAPYLLPRDHGNRRPGHGELFDSLLRDGLEDPYEARSMGFYADRWAARLGLARQTLDDYAVRSYQRAQTAIQQGYFQRELTPVPSGAPGQPEIVTEDEGPARLNEPKLRGLKPAFSAGGVITAGNASSLNDGAAVLLVASPAACARHALPSRARIAAATTFSREPGDFLMAPIDAIGTLLDRAGWSVASVDLFEINEAFAVVPLAAQGALGIPDERLNIHGGAIALGHPIGCSGARIVVTLLNALERTGGRRGVACACIGGGEAIALGIETGP